MRRVVVLLFVLLAVSSLALAGGSRPSVRILASQHDVVVDSSLTLMTLPTSYTFYSVSTTDDFYVTRWFDGAYETGGGVKVPAGQNLTIPAPEAIMTASGYWRHKVLITDNADTTICIPWSQ